jgi:hypothetical protein
MEEQYRTQQPSQQSPYKKITPLALAGVAVVVVGLALYGILSLGKQTTPTTSDLDCQNPPCSSEMQPSAQGGAGGGGGGNGGAGGGASGGGNDSIRSAPPSEPTIVGTVTSVSATSITIQPTDGSSAKTYGIIYSTREQKSGSTQKQPFNSNDVQVGDTVGIAESSMASGQADVIFPDYQ